MSAFQVPFCRFLPGRLFGAWLALALLPAAAMAQGILLPENPHFRVPRPMPQPVDGSYRIRELMVDASIRDQVATTQVTQLFENTGNVPIEASFCFPIPYDGAIDRMTFMVDGKEYEAKLLKADEARRIYEGYVRRNQDPALLEWIGHGMFRSSVFPIPAGATRTVTLKYSQLLRRDQQLTDYLFPLSTARYTSQPVSKLSLRVAIESAEKIRSIYSPTHNVDIKRDDEQHAVVSHSASDIVPGQDFRLVFDSARGKIGASLISCWPDGEDQGYFILLASPELSAESTPVSKTVIFVVDQSGSMSGEKIAQARDAAKFVINNLRDGDLFNVISYETAVHAMAPELQRFSSETRGQAVGFVNSINAGGSTNIDGALRAALDMIHDSSQPAYIVFLTDGLPTTGETNELKLAENCRGLNRHGARLICFGVGYDLNSRLLDRLARENHGQTEYVRPNEDIEASVARLYGKIAAPVLAGMDVRFELDSSSPEAGDPVNRMYPKGVTDMFAGSQVVLIGRYRQPGPVRVKISGKVGDRPEAFTFDLALADRGSSDKYRFVPQLWAVRRIGDIIDQIDLQGTNEELVRELVDLSLKYGIVTPYTSYLADENTAVASLGRGVQAGQVAENLMALHIESGAGGFAQRNSKQAFRMADNIQAGQQANESYGMDASAAGQVAGLPAPSGGFLGGGRGGAAGGNAPSPGAVNFAGQQGNQGLRKVGNVTLYVRGQTVVAENAADVDPDRDQSSIVDVRQFSEEYFRLVTENTAEENLILAEQKAGETLLVRLRGKTYRITRPNP